MELLKSLSTKIQNIQLNSIEKHYIDKLARGEQTRKKVMNKIMWCKLFLKMNLKEDRNKSNKLWKSKNENNNKNKKIDNKKDKGKFNSNYWHLRMLNFVQLIILNPGILFLIIEKNRLQCLNRIIIIIVHRNKILLIILRTHIIKHIIRANRRIHGCVVKKEEVFMDKNTINIKNKNLFKDLHIRHLKM